MVGEQIGFDEGGVFQSLSDSIYTKTTVEYTYGKRGGENVVIEESTTVINVTGAHVLAAVLGPALVALIIRTKGEGPLDETTMKAMMVGSPFGLAGIAAGYAVGETFGAVEEYKEEGGKIGTGYYAKGFASYLNDLAGI